MPTESDDPSEIYGRAWDAWWKGYTERNPVTHPSPLVCDQRRRWAEHWLDPRNQDIDREGSDWKWPAYM